MSKGKTITKEIRIHIRHDRCWVEHETKTGRISKMDAPGGLTVATQIANTLRANAGEWIEDEEQEEQ